MMISHTLIHKSLITCNAPIKNALIIKPGRFVDLDVNQLPILVSTDQCMICRTLASVICS